MSKKLLVLFRVYSFDFEIFPSFGRKDSGNLSPTPLPDNWKGTVRFSGHKQVANKETKNKMSYTYTKNLKLTYGHRNMQLFPPSYVHTLHKYHLHVRAFSQSVNNCPHLSL